MTRDWPITSDGTLQQYVRSWERSGHCGGCRACTAARHSSLIGDDRRSSSGSLAKLTAMLLAYNGHQTRPRRAMRSAEGALTIRLLCVLSLARRLIRSPLPRTAEAGVFRLGNRVDILLTFVGFNFCSIILLVKRQMINLLSAACDITFHQWIVRHSNIFIAFNVQLFSDFFGDV